MWTKPTIVLFGSYNYSKMFIVFQKTVAMTIMKGVHIHEVVNINSRSW